MVFANMGFFLMCFYEIGHTCLYAWIIFRDEHYTTRTMVMGLTWFCCSFANVVFLALFIYVVLKGIHKTLPNSGYLFEWLLVMCIYGYFVPWALLLIFGREKNLSSTEMTENKITDICLQQSEQ